MGRFIVRLVFSFVLLYTCNAASINKDECNLPENVINEIAGYADVANQFMELFIEGEYKGKTWQSIADFVDKFGHRLTGTQTLEDSIDYMVDLSNQYELDNVHTEDVNVPNWVRGEESVTLLQPRVKNLPMLGIGLSVGTPVAGITANAVVVKSFDELNALSDDDVAGKIVVYDPPFTTYGEMVQYRGGGAVAAAKKGAVAALVRSVTQFSLATPHTGAHNYDSEVQEIPIAAITLEDADYLRREQDRGHEIVINIKMSATQTDGISRNMISELKGGELEEKVVVVSGHIDSWDVGDGSMDDAGGCFISWLAPIAMKKLGLQPRRTVRTILFTAEEQGLVGSQQYVERHIDEVDNLSFVMESDFGTFAPLGLTYKGSTEGECVLKEILKLFTAINATELTLVDPGPDISFWTAMGIPGSGLLNKNENYFWFHHTEGDTINVLDTEEMDKNGAFWGAVTYIIADMEYEIPRNEPDK